MINIEKYKDEIIHEYNVLTAEYRFRIDPGFEAISRVYDRHEKRTVYIFSQYLDWLCAECKEPPLTEKEHDYLKVVFKPFWQDIAYVKKDNDSDGEYLLIKFKKGRLIDEEAFSPYWLKGTFFKGMEVGETYTLEELGITYESRKEE